MDRIKTISMYLPQYHRVLENDLWWGEGYTDWVAVKSATRLFDSHMQPNVPKDNNYYDLLDKSTLKKQALLMKKYGIDGQCFYHYYFKDGKKILERPAENLLLWKDIDMPFFFSWDSNSWTRTWSNVRGNSWADKFEKKDYQSSVLLFQEFGGEREWKEHFDYLIQFFKDSRYIKVENKPVFMFHGLIPCFSAMRKYWDSLAKKEGFDGLFIIVNGNQQTKPIDADASMIQSPHSYYTLRKDENCAGLRSFDYEEIWKKTLEVPLIKDNRTYLQCMCNYDDSPRRGKNGSILLNFNVDTFYNGLIDAYGKSIIANNEFLFINAWNEWGEGMYLEPDERNGYALLETVKKAQIFVESNEENIVLHDDAETYSNLIMKLERANDIKRMNLSCISEIIDAFENNSYNIDSEKKVAIYGAGIVGRVLCNELEKIGIEIEYYIDKSLKDKKYNTYTLDDDLPFADIIIVTVLHSTDTIISEIDKKVGYYACSIYDVIYGRPKVEE